MKRMGKMKLFAVACIVALSATVASAADMAPYVGGSVGLFMPTDSRITDNSGVSGDIEYNAGYSLSAVGGVEFNNGLRLEGELTFKSAEMDKFTSGGTVNSDLSVLAALASGYFDFKNTSPFTPYVGGGLGVATVYVGRITNSTGFLLSNKDDDTVFAYQIGTGVGINVGSNVTLDLGYRYFGTTDPEFNDFKAEFDSHNLLAGVRYKF
ncbi:MAG: porin family protein [Verrucomicrobia bacterium]|nr:porin family protein [Deltaproteobacteria bacterium]